MHVLGIDAGGTKTVCLLADAEGRVLAQARGGGANLRTAGELGVEKVLHAVMEEALGDRRIVPEVICLGLAGADRDADWQVVGGIMRRIGYKARTLVVNDALVALVAGVGEAPGVAIITGTGSIVYGRNRRNEAARAGGWGHLIGDEGSGYWIGRKALAAVLRAGDGRGPETSLTPLVLGHFGVRSAADLVQVLDHHDVRLPAIAAVGAVVMRAMREGDAVAAAILDGAADELAAAAASVVRRLGMERQSFTFVLAGGIFQGVPWLRDEVARRAVGLAPAARAELLGAEPAVGAVRLALEEARGGARIPRYL